MFTEMDSTKLNVKLQDDEDLDLVMSKEFHYTFARK